MKNDKRVQFLCKDCDTYNRCQYYYSRNQNSYICKNFRWTSDTSQQRTGRWKFTVYDANRIGHYECSECHWNVLMNVSDYCPHCGAKMEVLDD